MNNLTSLEIQVRRVLEVPRSIPGRDTKICGAHLHRASGATDL